MSAGCFVNQNWVVHVASCLIAECLFAIAILLERKLGCLSLVNKVIYPEQQTIHTLRKCTVLDRDMCSLHMPF
jgi:hypothetical protein